MTGARELSAGLQLLDRQILNREGLLVGKVDDLELETIGDGDDLYVTAILTGPGVLVHRLGARRFGSSLQRVNAFVFGREGVHGAEEDPSRLPFHQVIELARDVKVAVEHDRLATSSGERWVRDHVMRHIPGGRRAHN